MTTANLWEWNGPFGLPDFSKICDDDFKSAFDFAIKEALEEIESLANLKDRPTLENFLIPFELYGKKLNHVCSIFFLYSSVLSNDKIQALEQEFIPQLSRYSSKITMDPRLFLKIDTLYQQALHQKFDAETTRVIELTHKAFVRSGAKLNAKDKQRLTSLKERLSLLGATFAQNLLKDEAEWVMFLQKDDLGGLPDDLIATMRQTALERNEKQTALECQEEKLAKENQSEDVYALTLARSVMEPFLCYSNRRDLRKIANQAFIARGENNNDFNNHAIMLEIIALRKEIANILGFENFATFKLENSMAKTPKAVMDLLLPIWQKAIKKAKEEQDDLQQLLTQSGCNDPIAFYDWRYFTEKLQSQRFSFDEADIKPYFELNNVIKAAFATAHKLFGLTFKEISNIPLWHQDAKVFEVKNQNNENIGLFIGDYFARPSKRSGAWMSALQSQHKLENIKKPIIYNICNFAKPPKNTPALLSLEDAKTLFHEFGHALHGLLSNVTWPSIAGTAVARDFVELPSQLYEHWLTVPEILEHHAIHVQTKQAMPKEMIDKIIAAGKFNAGFNAIEFLSSALFDMHVHCSDPILNMTDFEQDILQKLHMPDSIIMRHRPSHFSHIFSGDGYAAGYYSYMWSEVLDADAFQAFEETGNVFDKETAKKLYDCIYSRGGSQKPEELYRAFRGRMPSPEAMIAKRGL